MSPKLRKYLDTLPYARCSYSYTCPRAAEVVLVAPSGEPVPGGYFCRAHVEPIVQEYQDKLGETWTLHGQEVR